MTLAWRAPCIGGATVALLGAGRELKFGGFEGRPLIGANHAPIANK